MRTGMTAWRCKLLLAIAALGARIWVGIAAQSASAVSPLPPGIIIDHSPASSGLYIGSPSLTVLTNGDYLASHDLFGPQSSEFERPQTLIFRSRDQGKTWSPTARLSGVFWNNLFTHRGAAYLMGADRHHGRLVIRRSTDGGANWSDPRDGNTGLLTASGQYHPAPMPGIEHGGRLWRTFEDAMGGTEWGKRYRAGLMSAPVDADLLHATNWSFSSVLPRDPAWLAGRFNAWLEGNAVVSREGSLVNILRVDTPDLPEVAARVEFTGDGKTARFDPTTGFMPFPGGAKKFLIRFDPVSDKYWALSSPVMDRNAPGRPATIRNCLALLSSEDLKSWQITTVLLRHPDQVQHGFQYPDWHFDGDDIIAVVRTAFDDAEGGARNQHDANFLTFHRFKNFRRSTPGKELESTSPLSNPAPNEPALR